ncbi:MAG: hypothetical protein FH749_10680 [Firmicutes bacterium]|nr:hypothetical protein [Bacillota bacterium]
MNIRDFEKNISEVILQRGWDYFQTDRVTSLEQEDAITYVAFVEGTDLYSVTVTLDGAENIEHSNCDCPYDAGPFCKHEVAVFFAIRDLYEESTTVTQFKSTTNHKDIRNTLSSQSKDKLVEFILGLTDSYPEIRQKINLQFSGDTKSETLIHCRRLIHTYLDRHSDQSGFIGYHQVDEALTGAEMVLNKANTLVEEEEFSTALVVYFTILQEIVPTLDYCDDSDGFMSGLINETLDSISVLSHKAQVHPEINILELFEKTFSEAQKDIYSTWNNEWQLSLLETCALLAPTSSERSKLDHYLNQISKSSQDKYYEDEIALLRHQLLDEDNPKLAAEYLQQNIHRPDFRRMAINSALEAEDYSTAEKLALDGESHDARFRGLVSDWKKMRYETYKKSGQLEKQRTLAKELVLGNSIEHYKELKAAYPTDQWPEVYSEVIQMLEQKQSRIYTEVLLAEEDMPRLMKYLSKHKYQVTDYYRHLLPDYKEEVTVIMTELILEKATDAGNRSHYRKICSLIRKLRKIADRDAVEAIVNKLKKRYPQRPAFQDELSKIRY